MLKNNRKGKIAFYLMTYKGYRALYDYLLEFEPEIIEAVIISRDKNLENDYYNEIIKLCKENQIPYYDKSEEYDLISAHLIFTLSWRWIIKSEKKIIVLHDSLLPKYRGFAPVVNSLINGEKQLGVTALLASENYDSGDIIYQEMINIIYPIKIEKAIDFLIPLYSKLLISITTFFFINGKIVSYKQDHSKATYSLWRDEEDYIINWNQSSSNVKRFIDAVGYPYKGAKTYFEENEIIINDVSLIEDIVIENRTPGKVIFFDNDKPIIVCKTGLIRIEKAVDKHNTDFIFEKFRMRLKSK